MKKKIPVSIAEVAYIAGLFDGEGCVQYKQHLTNKRKNGKRYKTWRVTLEMSMTDKPVIDWVHQTLGVGTVNINIKNKSPSSKPHWKDQWRWRCHNRDALYVCKLLWPHAQVKMHKIEQVIDHYEPRAQELGDNVVDLESERIIRRVWP